jgi:signal transduction histidine kinase
MATMATRLQWLKARPSARLRFLVGVVVVGLATAALLIPSNISVFPIVTRLVAIGVGLSITASGMVIWERRPGNLIGPLLLLAGALWMIGRMQGADGVPLALAANLANSLAQVLLLTVLVAFPGGVIPSRAAWAVVVFGFVAVVGGNLAQIAAVEMLRTPGREGPNPLHVPMDAALRTALVGGFQAAAVLGGLFGIVWLVVRWIRGSGPARRAFLPIFLAGVAISAIVLGCELLIRVGGRTAPTYYPLVTIQILSFVLLPLAIMTRVLRDRMARGAVADLVVELGTSPPPERLQEALASALGDPTLEVAYWSSAFGTYLDRSGAPVALPAAGTGRAVTLLERDHEPLAAIVHDPALAEDPGLVAAVGSAVRLAVENERLTAEVRSQLDEVRASRTRIVEAADAERKRVERNLHDGAQQRLVALSLAIRRAKAQLPADAGPEATATLDDAAEQLKLALSELRELARGIHPAILTEAGLGPALRAVARESPIPVTLDLDLPDRLPVAAEAAVYFVVAEALTNVAKYADATRIDILAATVGDDLRVEIADDGQGGADPAAGTGLRGLADRVSALGGRFDVRSPAGGGTRVVVRVPLVSAADARP